MKIVTQQEEAEHNRVTWEGGTLGALGGLAVGAVGVTVAGARLPAFRSLGLPFRGFIVTATTAFGGVVTADRYSRAFERSRHSDSDYKNRNEEAAASTQLDKPLSVRAKEWVSENRYPIVFGSWVASMAIALGIVSRNPHQSAQQKLVQARVYAQGLTIAVLVASFALESNDLRAGKGRWETVKIVDPDDPEHKRIIDKQIHHEAYQGEDQWMDMIESQERKMRSRGEKVWDREDKSGKSSAKAKKSSNGGGGDASKDDGAAPAEGEKKAQSSKDNKKEGGGKKEQAQA